MRLPWVFRHRGELPTREEVLAAGISIEDLQALRDYFVSLLEVPPPMPKFKLKLNNRIRSMVPKCRQTQRSSAGV